MALDREQIDHLEHRFRKYTDKPWKNFSHSRKWLKKQMNKFIRLSGKNIDEDSTGGKCGKKPFCGWEY